jgi:hypothetical protein
VEVENQVTQKIEQRLFKLEGVRREKTYSTSMNGAMFVNVELEDSLRDMIAAPFSPAPFTGAGGSCGGGAGDTVTGIRARGSLNCAYTQGQGSTGGC